jgi:hypothetical protein
MEGKESLIEGKIHSGIGKGKKIIIFAAIIILLPCYP